jgi:hypothetical protein
MIVCSAYLYIAIPGATVRICRIGFVTLAVMPVAVAAERVAGGNLDRDDPDAVGVLDPHLDQALALRCWSSGALISSYSAARTGSQISSAS